ncbi:MAG: TGS domain-containing protein [Acidiferrobacterales bacterium]
MPTNTTPEYKAAEAAFRQARDSKERLECLREMLRTIPKHKGTDHLQADIKTRVKQLTEELAGPKKGGARGGPPTVIRPEGAAQVALIGPPNTGKSTLQAKLTGSHAPAGPYPFTTQFPQPGMLPYEDIYFQLIDLPPVAAEHPVPWIANTLQPADVCLLVVELGDPACVDQVMAVHEILAAKGVTMTEKWDQTPSDDGDEEELNPFAIHLPVLLIATKADLIPALQEELQVFEELADLRYPAIAVSATTGEGLDQIAPWLFRNLGIVRVYTKPPGRPPDKDRPFTVRRGQTVHDVAVMVHRDLGETLKYARLWRGHEVEGRQVGHDHPVADGDIIELHT